MAKMLYGIEKMLVA